MVMWVTTLIMSVFTTMVLAHVSTSPALFPTTMGVESTNWKKLKYSPFNTRIEIYLSLNWTEKKKHFFRCFSIRVLFFFFVTQYNNHHNCHSLGWVHLESFTQFDRCPVRTGQLTTGHTWPQISTLFLSLAVCISALSLSLSLYLGSTFIPIEVCHNVEWESSPPYATLTVPS